MLWNILWRNKNTFSLTFTISFSLLGILWHSNPLSWGVGFLGKLTDRLSGALNDSLQLPGTIWVELDKYRELQKRYEQAQKTLEQYRLEKDKFDRLKEENEVLRQAMDFQPRREFSEVKAEVLGVRINSISPRIIISRGSEDGVEPFMPVIARSYDTEQNLVQAVVGVVASVDSTTSIVQPLIHPGFRLGVRIPENSQWAILSGNSGNISEVLLTFLSKETSPLMVVHSETNLELTPGQTIVTSGAGGIFPPGIPVGTLIREGKRNGEFKTAYVRPFATVGSLDIVTVVLKRKTQWTEQWNTKIEWDKNLVTEFGKPVYPRNTRRKPAPARPRKTAPRVTEQKEKPEEETETPRNQSEPRQPRPRRIQNVNIPAPGIE